MRLRPAFLTLVEPFVLLRRFLCRDTQAFERGSTAWVSLELYPSLSIR